MALVASGYILDNGFAKLIDQQTKKRLQFSLRRDGNKLVAVVQNKRMALTRQGENWVAAGDDISLVIRRKTEKNLWTVLVFRPDVSADALSLLSGADKDDDGDEEAGL